MNAEPEPLRDFADRFFRDALRNPENLRDFLMDAVPTLAPHFDFSRVALLNPQFRLPDWRRREADLLFEIPYRYGEEERLALVCVLLEHQTRPDARMPLRTLIEVVLYWERQWRAWEEAEQPKDEFRLTPVLPIVLHAGTRPWGAARTLADMLGPPDEFHGFAPAWGPIFWELSTHSPQELLDAQAAFLRVLAIVRVEDEERSAFARVFQETWRRLEPIHGTNRVRWTELVQLIFGWVFHRRPDKERKEWIDLAATAHENELHQAEVKAMGQTSEKTMIEVAYEEHARFVLLLLGRQRFGEPTAEVEATIQAVEDLKRLNRMTARLLAVSSWTELLETH